MKDNSPHDAVAEIEAAADDRINGPKHEIVCPDCGAKLAIHLGEDGRYEIRHIAHAT